MMIRDSGFFWWPATLYLRTKNGTCYLYSRLGLARALDKRHIATCKYKVHSQSPLTINSMLTAHLKAITSVTRVELLQGGPTKSKPILIYH